MREVRRLLPFAVVVGLIASGCGTSSVITTDPTPAKCQLSLTPPSVIDAAGGTTTFAVTAEPECAWRATPGAEWISGLSPSSGQGSATVQFRVAPNDTASSRAADIVVESDRVLVSQRAQCRFDLAPASQSVGTAGGAGSVAVTAPSDCAWTATATVTWISLSEPFTGSGSGSVRFTIAPNSGNERTGTIIVGGQRSNITQAGNSPSPPPTPPNCSYSIAPATQNIGAAGGGGAPIAVTASNGCPWSTSSSAGWIAVTSGASGSGNGTVAFTVAGNTGGQRTGTLTIGGQSATVTQAPCTYSISPGGQSFTAAGGPSSPVAVSTLSTCQWTTVSNASWITVSSGATGTGIGSAGFIVAANTGAGRTGTLTIAGVPFAVSQDAPCTQGLSPSNQTFSSAGGDGSITVVSPPGCQWTSRSNDAWISVQSGVTGNGGGRVEYRVDASSGGTRSGTISIGDATFTVTQQ
jgi:hypothetical protein